VLKAARGDSAVGFRVDSQVPTEDDWARADFRDEAADTPGDDIASCRDNPVDSPKQWAEVGTKAAADDKGSTSLPSTRGCNKRGALPNSIPSRPIPKDGRPAMPQFQSLLQN
jgi:hypothetical protein